MATGEAYSKRGTDTGSREQYRGSAYRGMSPEGGNVERERANQEQVAARNAEAEMRRQDEARGQSDLERAWNANIGESADQSRAQQQDARDAALRVHQAQIADDYSKYAGDVRGWDTGRQAQLDIARQRSDLARSNAYGAAMQMYDQSAGPLAATSRTQAGMNDAARAMLANRSAQAMVAAPRQAAALSQIGGQGALQAAQERGAREAQVAQAFGGISGQAQQRLQSEMAMRSDDLQFQKLKEQIAQGYTGQGYSEMKLAADTEMALRAIQSGANANAPSLGRNLLEAGLGAASGLAGAAAMGSGQSPQSYGPPPAWMQANPAPHGGTPTQGFGYGAQQGVNEILRQNGLL